MAIISATCSAKIDLQHSPHTFGVTAVNGHDIHWNLQEHIILDWLEARIVSNGDVASNGTVEIVHGNTLPIWGVPNSIADGTTYSAGAVGVPLRSVAFSVQHSAAAPRGSPVIYDAFVIPVTRTTFITIPTGMMWLPFLIDAAIWGAVFVIVVRLMKWCKVSIRRRRGQCVRCRYLLVGLARCPECGEHR